MRRRNYSGPAFLSGAFRPFFLAASVWGAASIGLWLYMLSGAPSLEMSGTDWHSHEMIFGFVSAALAGFILTAIPNWTGRLPVRGAPLAGLALLWLLGRLAILGGALFGLEWVALLDLLFPFALFFVVLREIVSGKNKRNFPVAILFGVLAFANVLFHAEEFTNIGLSGHGWRLGLGVVIMLISVISGRVVPSFTRNWLAKNGAAGQRLPAQPSSLDKTVLLLCAAALLAWVLFPDFLASGVLLMLAGAGQLVRLSRWRGLSTLRASIVFVLHIGYGWIGLGFILLGLSVLWSGFAGTAAIHGLTIGGVGTMIAAVMSRASLGHSGRTIKAGLGLSLVYIFISLGALARLLSGFLPDLYMALVYTSGGLWIAAFALYAALFLPLYFTPRAMR